MTVCFELSVLPLISCHKFPGFSINCDIISLCITGIAYLLYADIVLYLPWKMYNMSVKDAKQLLKGDRTWLKWAASCEDSEKRNA